MQRVLGFVFAMAICGHSFADAVSRDEAADWVRWTVPLPKEITISEKALLPANDVVCVLPKDATGLLLQSAKEIHEALGRNTEAGQAAAGFSIHLQIGGTESETLKNLKNANQAYRILPNQDGLLLVGLTERGVYYAAKTLQQLIKAKAKDGNVEIPILTVTDWPDIEIRGLWGSDSFNHIRWMSDRKMNIEEQISGNSVDANGKALSTMSENKSRMYKDCPKYGVDAVPVLLHTEHYRKRGLFDAYPELDGQGGNEGAICYAKPDIMTDIYADWIVGYASIPGVNAVDAWMAENLQQQGGCQCEICKHKDRNVEEARIIVNGWRKARQKNPDMGLYLLTSEETEKSNEKIFAELPQEVRVWFYHSLLTYNSGDAPMLLYPYLPEFTKAGGWLGVCANFCAEVGMTLPFTGADFMKGRVKELMDKGCSGLLGYATPRVYYVFFNTEAAAEWTWNFNGRTPREFAYSYAVRQGMDDPEKFAEWSDTMGPVSWDLYGSHWPAGERRTCLEPVAKQLKEGTLPDLGYVLWDAFRSPWGDIKTVEQLNNAISQTGKAHDLAKEMGIDTYIHETLVVQGYMISLRALWGLKQIVTPDGVAKEKRKNAEKYFRIYSNGLELAKENLPKWEKTLPMRTENDNHTKGAVELTEKMIESMKETAKELGFDIQ